MFPKEKVLSPSADPTMWFSCRPVISHTPSPLSIIKQIKSLDEETKACMEHTGKHYEPVANWLSDVGILGSAVNSILIRDFVDNSLRTPKADKADS